MYQKPTQPAEIGRVIEDAIAIYRATFRRCAPIALLGALSSAALDVFVVLFAQHEGLPFDSLESSLLVYQQPPVIALALLQAVVMLALFGSLLATQDALSSGRQPLPLTTALGTGFGRLGRCVMATAIYTAVTVVGCLLILPGIYVGNIWSLYPAAIYVDDAGALHSLDASRRLTSGHWWHTATVLGAGVAAVLVIAMVFDALAGGLSLVGSAGSPGLQSGMQLLGDVVDVFVLPIVPATLLALYNDLKLRAPPEARASR